MGRRTGKASKQRQESAPPVRTDDPARRQSWFQAKWPVIKFVLGFAVLMGAFEAAWATKVVREDLFPAYLRLNASAGAGVIRLFGHDARASGITIASSRFSIEIARGCDAIEPAAIFVSGVVSFPAPMLARVYGTLIGAATLLLLNLARIASLFFIGIYYPKLFHMMHVDVWQAIFIFLAVLFWVIWAWWATKPKAVPDEVSPATA